MQRRVDLDAWYVANASLALDMKILLRTPLEILRPRNAY
jgi:putative colanic acid biosynthesis UDP-glucose lipid carrier transferase